MINLKQLESDLWEAANQLRANSKLTAAEYKDPVLGLIFLRYAYNRYLAAIERIEPRLVTPRGKRKPNKDDFRAVGAIMLPEKAQFRYLAGLPEGEDLAQAINEAMRLIEEDYPDLEGVLPKEYQLFGDDLLKELVRIFNREALDQGNGDVFGRIYEYFLMQFSMMGAGAQEGGEFFTPPSLVQVLVNFMEPEGGVVYDPACGSGGMFVQTGRFIEKHEKKDVNAAITVYGTELKENNARLAKMNLAVHGIEGKILQGNTFYSDPFDLVGKCDYVIANPPFNVSKVDKERDFVKEDVRLPYGIPRTDNGNYLWIQYFLSYLNDHGRAGFVMASSAADAGHSEKDIREMLVESGQVDIIVSIANNFFYTRSLPCHLWFFDKAKAALCSDTVLMIDARHMFRKVNRTLNDFSELQQLKLISIVHLYRGQDTLSEADVRLRFPVGADSIRSEADQDKLWQDYLAWLDGHFPERTFVDQEGLCKRVSLADIRENDYSLNPGRYVGVSLEVEEDFDFEGRMREIKKELEKLQIEGKQLSQEINTHLGNLLS